VRNSEGAEFYDRQGRVTYVATGGFAGDFPFSSFALSVTPVAVENGDMERDYWYSASRKLAGLDSPEAIGREAARRACRRLGARREATTEVPVVFDPESAASLLRALAVAASGPSLYRGTSFLVGRLGTRLAPASVTIVDDPLLPGGLGSRPFDGEGLPSRRTLLVERGVLASYLLDTYSARKLSLAATGHAARESGGGVTVGYTNLYLDPGPYAPEEIIGSVARGLYVTELIGFGVNFVTGDYSRGAVGQWIDKGELAYPVEEVTIAGNLTDMLARIEMVGRDLAFRDQTAAPTLKIARMTVAGQ
jgi:PmbA protein